MIPQNAGGMSIIYHHPAIIALRQGDQIRERSNGSVHTEKSIGEDKLIAGFSFAPKQLLQSGKIAVRVNENLGSAKAATVDNTGMIECIAENKIT